jgi:hypothetical protein
MIKLLVCNGVEICRCAGETLVGGVAVVWGRKTKEGIIQGKFVYIHVDVNSGTRRARIRRTNEVKEISFVIRLTSREHE